MIWKKTLTSFIRIEFCFTESMVALKETSVKLFQRYRLPADSSTFNFVDIIHLKRAAKSRNLIVMMRNIDPWWDYTYSCATEEESMPFY